VIVQEDAVSHALRARAEYDTCNSKGAARLATRLERLAKQHGVRISLVHPRVTGARNALAVVEQPPGGQHVVSDYLVRGVVRCIEGSELASLPTPAWLEDTPGDRPARARLGPRSIASGSTVPRAMPTTGDAMREHWQVLSDFERDYRLYVDAQKRLAAGHTIAPDVLTRARATSCVAPPAQTAPSRPAACG
jgi:hypothetical protein